MTLMLPWSLWSSCFDPDAVSYVLFTQVVGSQARILYSDQKGRTEIATAFNEAVGSKKLKVS